MGSSTAVVEVRPRSAGPRKLSKRLYSKLFRAWKGMRRRRRHRFSSPYQGHSAKNHQDTALLPPLPTVNFIEVSHTAPTDPLDRSSRPFLPQSLEEFPCIFLLTVGGAGVAKEHGPYEMHRLDCRHHVQDLVDILDDFLK